MFQEEESGRVRGESLVIGRVCKALRYYRKQTSISIGAKHIARRHSKGGNISGLLCRYAIIKQKRV